jgi:NADP-reducing hydrogenase subunit HndD
MIDRAGIIFNELPDEEFDNPMGESTGASVIFGATGGVMEAALRTSAEWISGEPGCKVEFRDVRGTEGIKEAIYKIGDLTLKVAAISGLANARTIMDKIRAGEADYDFIEVMCCPGGCINGGGQPVQPASVRNNVDLKIKRAEVLYKADANKPLRKSHENPSLGKIYEEYFGEYGSDKAHEVLHTSYRDRSKRKYKVKIEQ